MTWLKRYRNRRSNDQPPRVIVSIQHPAHVHLFRNAIQELSDDGFEVYVFVREKDIAIDLLEQYEISHHVLAGEANSPFELGLVELKYEYRLTKAARQIQPDVMVAMGGVGISRPSMVSGAKCLVLTDTEHATLQNMLAFPFADRILTPECYQDNIGAKQVRYPGYHELAYLHPNRFTPDPSVKEEAGVEDDERFVILRLVSWDAMHDIGDSGLDDIVDVVSQLEKTGVRVLITSEADLPAEVENRQVTVAPHRIHHLMYYSDLYIGESATMATESAVLGTPAVFVSSSRRGYTDELEEDYGLVFNFSGTDRHNKGLERSIEILEENNYTKWENRRESMLERRIDTTNFIVSNIKKYCNK
ncbi:DUF354 domain-containing protein [Natronorubrum bangense]|uniref:DUF354 domain-containing protein n=1 Tax=Natronorubrum bangense JCM 10635 TaxID=1227500 RepID=L9VZL0_9EURY|nr:DUF354 domain-containing protein [Natronorubrum bangense]ELY42684.1 hypothetical protein C494_20318 [Natronorubrum bangense JCM 10635]